MKYNVTRILEFFNLAILLLPVSIRIAIICLNSNGIYYFYLNTNSVYFHFSIAL